MFTILQAIQIMEEALTSEDHVELPFHDRNAAIRARQSLYRARSTLDSLEYYSLAFKVTLKGDLIIRRRNPPPPNLDSMIQEGYRNRSRY